MAEKGAERRGLGRGLSALMGDISEVAGLEAAPARRSDHTVAIEDVAPNPDQPRRRFDDDALKELAASIRERGILQPLILRPRSDGATRYQIVAGERRWRAAQLVQLHEVPAIIRDFSDEEAMEVAIIENIQRDDLSPVDEARGYRRLMDQHGRTQEEMATALGKSRSHIANMLRLLQLPEDVLDHLAAGRLSAGQARALITLDDPSAAAREVIAKGLSVRETEQLGKKASRRKTRRPTTKDAETRVIEGDLSASMNLKVSIDADANGQSGSVRIRYKTLEELDDICRVLSGGVRAGSI